MAKFVLSVFDLFAWALRLAGVDYGQFRILLGVKLTLDDRRRHTAFQQQQQGRAPRNSFALTLLMNAFMGVFLAMTIAMIPSPLVSLTFVHAFVMLMVALSLIADFSSVLLDTTDNQILQPRPINSRTILAVRLAHIISYITLLALSLAAASFIAGTIKFGFAFPLVFALTLAASLCLTVGAVNILYLLALRLTNAEKLRDIILYFQIGMTIMVVGAYQLLPRLMDVKALATWSPAEHWWVYLIPPTWLAAPVEIMTGVVDTPRLILTALGVIVPIATLLIAMVLAPGFKEGLARLETAPGTTRHRPRPHGADRMRLSASVTRKPVERAAFEFLWTLVGRDRQFKLRTYPSVALVFIFSAVFVLSDPEGIRHAISMLPQSRKYLLALYMCCAMSPTAFLTMRYSDRFEAAWIYRILPLATPGDILLAGLKVVIVRLVVPSFAIVALVTLVIWGRVIVPDILLALLATLLMCAFQALLMGDHLPFSEPYGVIQSSGRATRSFLYLLLPAALGGLHYLLTFIPFGIPVAIPFVALATWLSLRAFGRTAWSAMLVEERAVSNSVGNDEINRSTQ